MASDPDQRDRHAIDSHSQSRPTDDQPATTRQSADAQWTDTIDDWDVVLDGADTDDQGSTPEATSTIDSGSRAIPIETDATDVDLLQTDGGDDFVRIDPISDSLLRSMAAVLPESWLADTEAQQLIQWVVYTFLEETDPERPTAARVETAIDRTATRTAISAAMLTQLCTNSLYRGRSGASVDNFVADLAAIQRRAIES